jgi:hypothetical protein
MFLSHWRKTSFDENWTASKPKVPPLKPKKKLRHIQWISADGWPLSLAKISIRQLLLGQQNFSQMS